MHVNSRSPYSGAAPDSISTISTGNKQAWAMDDGWYKSKIEKLMGEWVYLYSIQLR